MRGPRAHMVEQRLTVQQAYDAVAEVYDGEYQSPRDIEQNGWVKREVLRDIASADRILDVGAGTGLLLDLFPLATSRTVNVDPSPGMLHQLEVKHPGARVVTSLAEHYIPEQPFSFVISLFGAVNYIDRPERLLAPPYLALNGRAFLMFYGPRHAGPRVLLAHGIPPLAPPRTVEEVAAMGVASGREWSMGEYDGFLWLRVGGRA